MLWFGWISTVCKSRSHSKKHFRTWSMEYYLLGSSTHIQFLPSRDTANLSSESIYLNQWENSIGTPLRPYIKYRSTHTAWHSRRSVTCAYFKYYELYSYILRATLKKQKEIELRGGSSPTYSQASFQYCHVCVCIMLYININKLIESSRCICAARRWGVRAASKYTSAPRISRCCRVPILFPLFNELFDKDDEFM